MYMLQAMTASKMHTAVDVEKSGQWVMFLLELGVEALNVER
jgi:hypothetical protein